MSRHSAQVFWQAADADFCGGKYSRAHLWRFDGGIEVPASASPAVVKVPYSEPSAVDPEEAFVAALSSCHMLGFLYEAARRGFEVLEYKDDAYGELTKNEQRVPWISAVVLSPRIEFRSGKAPSEAQLAELHEAAHKACFIANSVKTNVTVRALHSGA